MNDKELIKKLGELGGLKANKDWKERSRSFLLSEVQSSVVETEELSFFEKLVSGPKWAFSAATQQAWAVAIIAVIIIGGGLSTQAASKNARPGDSLYLARVFSEKAKVAVTFNKEEKAKLDMQFASNRAKEITEVLAELDMKQDNEGSEKKVAKLSENFKEEIEIVKKNIEEIKNIRHQQAQEQAPSEDDPETGMQLAMETEEEEASFGIGFAPDPELVATESGKDEQGVDIYDPNKEEAEEEEEEVQAVPEPASSTPAEDAPAMTASSTESEDDGEDVDEMLSNAQQSLEAKDFTSAKEMLDAVDTLINEDVINTGEVKGASTTSEESGGDIDSDTATTIPSAY